MSDVTLILNAISSGDPTRTDELFSAIYGELRQIAAQKMARERPGHTLQATALVHEAYIRMADGDQSWENRRHFLATAAEAMRRILVESARRRHAAKRGGNVEMAEFEESAIPMPMPDEKLLAVHDALTVLEAEDNLKARIVKLHIFAGLGHAEIAQLVDLSERSVRRQWDMAKVWLYQVISQS